MAKNIILICVALAAFANNTFAQEKSYYSCVIAVEDVHSSEPKRSKTAPAVEVGRFEFDTIGEEERIARAFPLPKTKLFVIASVFSTDDRMAMNSPDSLYLGIGLSNTSNINVMPGLNFATAEVPQNGFEASLVAVMVRVNKQRRLINMECRKMGRG